MRNQDLIDRLSTYAEDWRTRAASNDVVLEAIAALAALAAPVAATRDWNDIATAPKDGSWVLLYWPTMPIAFYPSVGFHHGDEYGWEMVTDREYGEIIPTHWAQCPAPPKPVGVKS